jgi:hypothetical protein
MTEKEFFSKLFSRRLGVLFPAFSAARSVVPVRLVKEPAFSRAAASLCLSRAAASFVLAAGVSPRCDATI